MQPLQPGIPTSDKKLVRQLLRKAAAQSAVGQRLKIITARLLGFPYLVNPLIGSPHEPEQFVASLSGFDCVTFMETVLALALADSVDDYPELLREIRYVYGEVEWKRRHHYTVDWARHNMWRGFLSDVTKGEEVVNRRKTLDLVPGLPPRIVSFSYFPKRKLQHVSKRLQDGDLIFFVSTRKGLDVFHVGLLFINRDRVMLRHATRSCGAVVEQELKEFIETNRMSGFIVVRPREKNGGEKRKRENLRYHRIAETNEDQSE